MLSFVAPTDQAIRDFRDSQRALSFTYRWPGRTRGGTAPMGFVTDHRRTELGCGRGVFGQACRALQEWRMFRLGWLEPFPESEVLAEGLGVAVRIRAAGFWWLCASSIVYLIEEEGPAASFGFAYGTLPGHIECGEERFLVEMDAQGKVWYDLLAFSRPRHPLVWAGYPFSRALQRRAQRESLVAMKDAVQTGDFAARS